MGMCVEQIQNVHRLFAEDFISSTPDVLDFEGRPSGEDTKPIIRTAEISGRFQALLNAGLFPDSQAPKHRVTPDCKNALGTHLDDIAGDSPEEFLRKGDADFLRSVDPKDFYTVKTHHGNTFFLPKWLTKSGFALWRTSTGTLFSGIKHGIYNVLKALNGENPETRSGKMEYHHVYQNPDTVTPVCWGEHKRRTTEYHKSKRDSRIDRATCGSEFYFINKLTGLLQIANMVEVILRTTVVDDEVSSIMRWIRGYTGNIQIIPSESAVVRERTQVGVKRARTNASAATTDDDAEMAVPVLSPGLPNVGAFGAARALCFERRSVSRSGSVSMSVREQSAVASDDKENDGPLGRKRSASKSVSRAVSVQ
jgi:hypothetical protein